MKLGTQVRLPDGREGTVVYNSLIGVGIKWGLHDPRPEDFELSSGDTVGGRMPEDFQWEPDALLREPWDGAPANGFDSEDCVGNNYDIIRVGLP